MQTVTATDAKNNFGDLMSRIESGPVSITRNGRIVATLYPASPAKTVVSSAEIDKLLALYADGLMNRHDIQDETGLAFDEILERMALSGLTLPVVRTLDRYNSNQKALYDEIFQHE